MLRAFARRPAITTNSHNSCFLGRNRYLQSKSTPSNPKFDDQQAHAQFLAKIRAHVYLQKAPSRLVILDALKDAYPHHSVTQTYQNYGILDLKEEKSLEAVLDTHLDHYSLRKQSNAAPDLTSSADLADEVELGRFTCKWGGEKFFIYAFSFWQNEWERVDSHYILHREDLKGANGRSKFADDLILAALRYKRKVDEEIWVYDSDWERSKKLFKNVKHAKWDDVVLESKLKADLIKDISSFFDRKDLYSSFAIPWKRGLIFHGLPGNGKTISIKAAMRTLSLRSPPVPTLYVKSLGTRSNEDHVRNIFEKARDVAPCLLVLEDLDSLITDNVRSFFLNEVDGLENNDGILMIGSTNHLDNLDVGISKRPSRFDRKFHFPLPSYAERMQYCDFWRRKLSTELSSKLPPDMSEKIAKASEGLSFAYLQEVFVSSMLEILTDSADLGESNIESDTIMNKVMQCIAAIRSETKSSRKSVEDADRHTVSGDAVSGDRRPAGFVP